MVFADFHIHTQYSDGSLSPEKILLLLEAHDIGYASLTDHDTVTTPPESPRVKWVPGIELSTASGNSEVHLLGYGFNPLHTRLAQALEEIRQQRRERFQRMIRKALARKIITQEPVFPPEETQAPGRYHMAQLLQKLGAVSSKREAFARFLGEGAPLYEPVGLLSVTEGLDLLKECGAFVSFAHPQRTKKDELIKKLAGRGLDALEAYYPYHDPHITKYYLNLIRKYHMLSTGGSDFHYGFYGFHLSEASVAPFIDTLYRR
jgi:hypothetical protein